MTFQVILATSPTEDPGSARLSLDFTTKSRSLGQAVLSFGERSIIKGAVFELSPGNYRQADLSNFATKPRYVDEPAIQLDVSGTIQTEDGKVEFSLSNLFSNDTLHMIAFSRKHFMGNVFHEALGVPKNVYQEPCVATCADGKSGQECVTCVHGEIIVKICC